MHPSVLPLERTLDMNTRLFLNCLDGVDDTMALERPKEGTNHVAFLALHMLDARYFLLRTAGVEFDCPFKDLLEGKKGVDDFEAFPALAEVRDAWADVSEKLSNRLGKLSEQELEGKPAFDFPIDGGVVAPLWLRAKPAYGGGRGMFDHEVSQAQPVQAREAEEVPRSQLGGIQRRAAPPRRFDSLV